MAKRFKRFKNSKIQKIQFRQDGYRIQKIFCGFLCFCGLVATTHSCISGLKDSRIQKIQKFKNSKIQEFNSAKTGIGFKKYSVAFCVSVLLWQKIQKFKDSRIQKFKDSKIQFRQDGYRIQKIFREFWCFRVSVAKKFVSRSLSGSWRKDSKDSRIQRFKD